MNVDGDLAIDCLAGIAIFIRGGVAGKRCIGIRYGTEYSCLSTADNKHTSVSDGIRSEITINLGIAVCLSDDEVEHILIIISDRQDELCAIVINIYRRKRFVAPVAAAIGLHALNLGCVDI